MTRTLIPLLALILMAAACKKETPATGGAETPKPAPEAKKGLEAADSNPEVVAAVKKVLECEWKRFGFTSKCEAYKSFTTSDLIKQGRADKTLVNMTEDGDEKVRWIAAGMLRQHGKLYESEPALAGRVVAALETEKSEMVAERLASAVSEIDLEGTKLVDKVIGLCKSGTEPVRAALIHHMLFRNRDSKKLYEFVKDAAKTAESAKVRQAAVRAFWVGTPRDKYGEVCKLWLDVAQTDKSEEVADTALRLAAQNPGGRCKEDYDAILELAGKKAKAGAVKNADVAYAVQYVHGQKQNASDVQKKRALSVAETLLKNEANKDMARSAALRFLAKELPTKAKALAKKHADDKSFFVKSAAKRILEDK
jgi:hypothetical protein